MIEELLRLVAGLARRLERLEVQEGIPIWTDWTPTVTQSVAVTVTVNEAKYAIVGKVCHFYGRVTVTGTGTGNNRIIIGGLPAAAQPAFTGDYATVGSFTLLDTGNTILAGSLTAPSASTFYLATTNNGDFAGILPNFALAANDQIGFAGTHRVA